jgi:hypothetical protein
MMMMTAPTILLQLIMTMAMWMPGVTPLMPNAALQGIEARYETDLAKRATLIETMTGLESQHQNVIGRITKLKQSPNTLTTRLALEDLLRQSKRLSEELGENDSRLRVLDKQIGTQRSAIVTGLEEQMRGLEATLAKATTTERAKTVKNLNALRKLRSSFEAPLPAAPTIRDLNAALSLADRVSDPDELLAAADELLDSEDQVRRRLSAIDQRLNELKESKRLTRRASSFSREERFFEETDRDRVIARYERTTTTQKGSDNDNTTAGEATNATENGSNVAVAANDQGANQNNADNALEFDAVEPSAAGAPMSEPLGDARGVPTVAPERTDDLFVDSTQTVVINANSDPSRSIGGADVVAMGVDGQIDTLVRERDRLKQQAEALRAQAKDLQRRAKTP